MSASFIRPRKAWRHSIRRKFHPLSDMTRHKVALKHFRTAILGWTKFNKSFTWQLTFACLRCRESLCRSRRTRQRRRRSLGTRGIRACAGHVPQRMSRDSRPLKSGYWPGPPSAPGTGPPGASPCDSASCWSPPGRGSRGLLASAHCGLSAPPQACSPVCAACPQYWIYVNNMTDIKSKLFDFSYWYMEMS